MAAPIKLAHVVFRTGRLAEMRDWYRTVLEARVVFENPFIAFETYDDEHHRIAFVDAKATEQPAPNARGVEHIAFTYASLGDLLGTYERLKALGIAPYWRINHGATTSLYYRDPDGNQIELQIDNFANAAEFEAFARTGAFQKNPIGVEFDPDTLLERFRRGDPLAELVKQGSA